MNINWFQGHMKKTRELIQKNVKLVDLVIELVDARIPYASRNPEMKSLTAGKRRILVFNKCDLADPAQTQKWKRYYESLGETVLLITAHSPKDIARFLRVTDEIGQEQAKKKEAKGIINQQIRAMIIGIPNVGKSTFINALVGKKGAKTGNRPGVTKGKQWLKLPGRLQLLDTPGVLWPKFDDQQVALHLAFTGAIRDEILDRETLALRMIERLQVVDSLALESRYPVDADPYRPAIEVMDDIARKRGCILRGNEPDYSRVANLILDEYRKGKLGRITFDRVEEMEHEEESS
jgi:ribosome biogenesis GTPase A